MDAGNTSKVLRSEGGDRSRLKCGGISSDGG